MEKSLTCFLNKLVSAQLNPGYATGEYSGPATGDLLQMLPYVAVPALLVLIAGLYCISIYRKRGTFPYRP
ncbi:hypothetical protein [Chitinophaga alhagiae]|uniref:hypothetical protein n=1 Tax=Chitinophaga alhagiae TaxID=2203219 RepID=UPI00130049AE|nr:hypothetical protein [Chitinophaga alhagiae]